MNIKLLQHTLQDAIPKLALFNQDFLCLFQKIS